MATRVLAFMAHPDDIEITAAGTLARLKNEAGCEIVLATMTNGDCGTVDKTPAEISRIRNNEAKAAATILDAKFYCAECMDLLVMYDAPTLRRVTEIVRCAQPDIVITAPPVDYMIDHENTSKLVRAATFAAPVPNFNTQADDPAPLTKGLPYVYYVDPIEHIDIFNQPIDPEFVVDITSTMETKERMLACHASQREWLREHHGMDEYIEAMKRFSAARGKRIEATYGEGFRQHKGHAYPRDNKITKLLGTK